MVFKGIIAEKRGESKRFYANSFFFVTVKNWAFYSCADTIQGCFILQNEV